MSIWDRDLFVRRLELMWPHDADESQYPFNLKAMHQWNELKFHPSVTYIVGENGVGKSTLMEAIAVAWGFNPEGGTQNFNFSTQATHSSLHEYVRLVRGARKPRDGFFFRAESYYNLATHIDELDREGGGRPIRDSYGGKSLHEQSHGESFLPRFCIGLAVRGCILWMSQRPRYRPCARWPCLHVSTNWCSRAHSLSFLRIPRF